MRDAVTGIFPRSELTLYGLIEAATGALTKTLDPNDEVSFNRLLVNAQDEVVIGDLYQLLTEAQRALEADPTADAVIIEGGVVTGCGVIACEIHTRKEAVE